MGSTIKLENLKDFQKALNLIEELNSFDNLKITLVDHDEVFATISKKEFQILIDTDTSPRFNFIEEVPEIIVKNIKYKLVKVDSHSTEANIDLNSGKFRTSYAVDTFQSESFNDEGIFKNFYPVNPNDISTFHREFETVTHQRGTKDYFYDSLRIRLGDVLYDITQLKENSKGYYVIECLSPQKLADFQQACFSIRQTIGFLNRLMFGDEEYTFDSAGNMSYTNQVRPTRKAMYKPITTNPYSYTNIENEVADEFRDRLNRISLETVSELATKIHTNDNFSIAVLVVLEVSSSRSLLLIPSSFVGIIELLSKTIGFPETGLEFPIPDNDLAKTLIGELNEVVDKHSDQLSAKSAQKLKDRLRDINKPVNKQRLTNDEKLTKPFEQLGILLSPRDYEIIKHRNDLLHGNILLKKTEDQSINSIDMYMAYVSAKLYTLISKMILKSVGYSGFITNHAKSLEKYVERPTEEEHFEKI